MIEIKAYHKATGIYHHVHQTYESEELAYERAAMLNEYWQSPSRIVRHHYLFAINQEQLSHEQQRYAQRDEALPVPRRLRRVRLELA